jgi:RIO-like serine/threonine protein kinase
MEQENEWIKIEEITAHVDGSASQKSAARGGSIPAPFHSNDRSFLMDEISMDEISVLNLRLYVVVHPPDIVA